MARKKGVHPDDYTQVYRQLAILTAAGMTVGEAVRTLTEESGDAPARVLLEAMKADLAAGKRPGETLAAHFPYMRNLPPDLFEKNPVAAAEFFAGAADFGERRQAMRRFLGLTFLYPALVAGLLVVVIALLMIVVVPMLAAMFADMGGALPLPTRIVIAASGFLKGWGGLVVLAALVALVAALRGKRHARYALLDRVPVLGGLNRKIAGAELIRNCSLLARAGTPEAATAALASAAVTNDYLAGRFGALAAGGLGLASFLAELRKGNLLPPAISHAARVGERSGTLAAVLQDAARYLEQDAEQSYDRFLVLLYPVTLLCLGVIVGFCVIAMYMPIFQMGSMG